MSQKVGGIGGDENESMLQYRKRCERRRLLLFREFTRIGVCIGPHAAHGAVAVVILSTHDGGEEVSLRLLNDVRRKKDVQTRTKRGKKHGEEEENKEVEEWWKEETDNDDEEEEEDEEEDNNNTTHTNNTYTTHTDM